ncbi:MAG: response regulator [Lentisphaerae bacterium]|nr:response regulator [Lentisphaerota bacterium]
MTSSATERAMNVLLVEDDEQDIAITRRLLGDGALSAFTLRCAGTLAAALSELDKGDVDLVILDLGLPDAEGWQPLLTINARAPAVPVVLLTGLNDESLGLESVKRGAQDYLAKGAVNRPQLIRAVRYAIERKRAEEALKLYRNRLAELVKRRTSQLRKTNEDLQREVAERRQAESLMRDAVARLEAHDHAKTQFVSNVSHELRTPLSSMSYAVENLLKGVVGEIPPRARAYLEMISEDCQRLIDTVSDILDVSRIEARRLALCRADLPVARFLEQTVEALRIQAEKQRLRLKILVNEPAGFVNCDPHKMERVILNVVHNAIKFTPEGGTIEVELRRAADPPETFVVDVTDDGVGIGAEHIPRVTERYYRVGEHVSGSGLGLALSKDILEMHGGRIAIASPPPGRARGTRVSLFLPAAPPPLVLAADDDPFVRQVLQSQLAAHGYRVVVCGGGEEVLDRLKKEQPAVLLVDLVMPGTDGVEVVARIKAQHALRYVPIVVVTGAEVDRSRSAVLEGFAIPVLAKPWKKDELLRCVEEALIGKQYVRASAPV